MKKTLAIFLTVAMMSFMLVACGDSAAAAKEAKTTGIYLSPAQLSYSNMRPQYNYYLTTFTQQELTLMDDNTFCLIVSSSCFSAGFCAGAGVGAGAGLSSGTGAGVAGSFGAAGGAVSAGAGCFSAALSAFSAPARSGATLLSDVSPPSSVCGSRDSVTVRSSSFCSA